jgi:uncharacterized protein
MAITKVGVISDTHGYLDPQLVARLAGVDHILHGGDIGLPWLLLELEAVAPVTAVYGNSDSGLEYRETELVVIGHRRFLVHHDVNPQAPQDPIKRRIIRENPDVVVFGHTHRKFCETIGGTLFVNPGYSGKPRGNEPRSFAILLCDESGITAEFSDL